MEAWYHPPNCMNDPQLEGHMASHIERRKFLATWRGSGRVAARGARAAAGDAGNRLSQRDDGCRFRVPRDGLKEAGFIDGHNVAIEFRWAENNLDRLPELVAGPGAPA